ncbi:MAG: recombinase zinc beta ribbon domain-containing protein, partial [Solirubrobacteraceae bacterium]
MQGLAICGVCGKRMAATYQPRCNGELVPDYACEREAIAAGTPPCQTIYGAGIDQAVAKLVL